MIEKADIIKLGLGVALLMGVAAGIDYWKELEYKKKNERAYRVYKLEQDIENSPDKEKLQELANLAEDSLYALAILSEFGDISYLDKLIGKLEDDSLKSLFIEKKAFLLYKNGKFKEALDVLSNIKDKDFNYPSAITLKAVIYEKMGDIEKAEGFYNTIMTKYPGTYFGKFATARLIILESLQKKG